MSPAVPGTLIELRRPVLPLPELIPALVREELLAGGLAMPVFFVLRGRKISRWDLSGVAPAERDALARDLGQHSDGVAMLGGIVGQPNAWAVKVESVKVTCTVLIALRDGDVVARRV